ncbi:hypothetical protein AGMMS49965_25040 [Bacteroidia bacterium]|nr:hypothetical protein AGMMS49965_25040 [Bacteroidia bacterium]
MQISKLQFQGKRILIYIKKNPKDFQNTPSGVAYELKGKFVVHP